MTHQSSLFKKIERTRTHLYWKRTSRESMRMSFRKGWYQIYSMILQICQIQHRGVNKYTKEQPLIDDSPWICFAQILFDEMLLRQLWIKQPVVRAFAMQLHLATRWLARHLIAWSRPHRTSVYSINRFLLVLRVRETGSVTSQTLKASWLWLAHLQKTKIARTPHKSPVGITIYHIPHNF
jgi:hypothetical protein